MAEEAAATTEAAAVVDTKAAVPAAEATQEFVVNGKPVKLTAAQVKMAVQKGLFADQKLKSVDVITKKTESLLASLKTPEGALQVLKEAGLSAETLLDKILESDASDAAKEKMSQWVYKNVVQQSQKTPEQIENDKKLSDYERLKKQEEERKQADMTAKQQAQVNQVYQAVRTEVTNQIVADKTFPQTEGSVRSVIEKLRVMNKQGAAITAENVTKALGLVKKDLISHQQTMLDAIEDPEKLIELFGETRALKISKALVARLQAKQKATAKEEKKEGLPVREKLQDRLSKKFGRTAQGYTVLDV